MIFSFFIYNSIIFIVLTLLIIKNKKYRKLDNIFLPLISLYIILISAIRYNVGRDFRTYEHSYYNIAQYDYWEIGFRQLITLLNIISNDAQLLFFTTSIMVYVPIIYTYRKYHSIILIITWVLLFYLVSLNQIRQAIAMAFIFYSMYFLKSNRKIFYILIAMAATFHNIAWVALVFPILAKIKIKNLWILTIFSPLLLSFNLANQFTSINQIEYLGMYNNYLENDELYAISKKFEPNEVFMLLIPIYFIFRFKKEYSEFNNIIKLSMFLYVALYLLSLNFYILYRVYFIFQLMIPFACMILFSTAKKIDKFIVLIYIFGLLLFYQLYIYNQRIELMHGNSITPYQTIFTINPKIIKKI